MDDLYIMGGSFTVVVALIALIYKKQEDKISELKTGLNHKISIQTCDLKLKTIDNEIAHLEVLIALSNTQNSKEHGEMAEFQKDSQVGQKSVLKELGEISKCLALLSEQIPCKTN